jgi:urease accessory protein
MKSNKIANVMTSTSALVLPTSVWAHSGHGTPTPTFFDGFAHPFTGLDHLILLASAGFILALVHSHVTRSRSGLFGLAGIFACGSAAMMGNVLIPMLGAVIALVCLTVAGMWNSDRRSAPMVLGTTTAISLQAGSHFLAWGDVPPHAGFAIGFGLASLVMLSAAYALMAVVGPAVCRSSKFRLG